MEKRNIDTREVTCSNSIGHDLQKKCLKMLRKCELVGISWSWLVQVVPLIIFLLFFILFILFFGECFSLPSVFWYSAKDLSIARKRHSAKTCMPTFHLSSVTHGKAFVECLRHLEKNLSPIVSTSSSSNSTVKFKCLDSNSILASTI